MIVTLSNNFVHFEYIFMFHEMSVKYIDRVMHMRLSDLPPTTL